MAGHHGNTGRRQAARLSGSCVLVIGLLASACSNGENSGEADASSTSDGGSIVDGGACDRSGLERTSEMAERDDELEILFYTARGDATRLAIDFYFSLGATDGAQTLTLTGEGLDTCSTCVFAHSGCGSLTCERAFMATSGLLVIDEMGQAGGSLNGRLGDALFVEVEIEAGTQETTIVPDGETWCFDDFAFDTSVVATAR